MCTWKGGGRQKALCMVRMQNKREQSSDGRGKQQSDHGDDLKRTETTKRF